MPRSENLPYQFLLKASVPTLQSFELSRLNHAANLKKQIADLVEQYLDESAAALLARAMIIRVQRSRSHSVDRKRPRPSPRTLSPDRLLSSGRPVYTARSISMQRAIPSTRSALRSKIARDEEVQQGLPFNMFAKSHAR
jgi:hypothetical protein